MPTWVVLIAFTDDVVIVATTDVATATYLLEKRLTEAMRLVMDWMNEYGQTLAMKRRRQWFWSNIDGMTGTYGNHTVHSQPNLKYLGLQVDAKMKYNKHAELVANKAAVAAREIARLMSTVKDPRHAHLKRGDFEAFICCTYIDQKHEQERPV